MSYDVPVYGRVERRLATIITIIITIIIIIICAVMLCSIAITFYLNIRNPEELRNQKLATENRVNVAVPDEIGKLPNGNKLMRVTVLDKHRVPSYYFYEASK